MKDASRKGNYGLGELIAVSISLVYTKLFWKGARLVRLPAHIRGKKGISYGRGFTTGYYLRIELNGDICNTRLKIGDNCVIGDYVQIVANYNVEIGNNVLFASRVFVTDSNHGVYDGEGIQSSPNVPPNERPMNYKSVIIGDNVWVGENVSIMAGVRIGKGAVIGANSVVTHNIPENCICAGVPAMVIKTWDSVKGIWMRTTEEAVK